MPVVAHAEPPFALSRGEGRRLARHAERAVRRARSRGESLAAVTVPVAGDVDPASVAFASRQGGEPVFVFEQPARRGAALAGLGCVRALEAEGPGRFRQVAADWRALLAGSAADLDGPPATGPVAVGGFAFAAQGASAPHWGRFPAASLHVPEVVLARRDGAVHLTLCALATPDDTAQDLVERLERRLASLSLAPLPMLDPSPAGAAPRVASTMPPEHYEAAVARAVERIKAGELEKIVLAREVAVHVPEPHDVPAIHGILREAFPECFVFAVSRGGASFIAASPELLLRRDGLRVSTLALAGSTRRSADPAVDDHLGEQLLRCDKDRAEQAIVARRIERTLRPHAVWVTSAPDPVVVKMANIQHLATPIRAQLAEPRSAVELAGLLHPTPAVGGEPFRVASPLIPALEGLDRGWYAGPVGWTDASEDGEFCVALRSALLDGPVARCFAGVGVVADSDPAAELAETEVKLQALLPVLAL
ncbi:isochorismate synthase [Capillimicrobium parvum]|uniref:isochorismate synthase n=1 Tax=Capillimicrobium parvum TaxID=2884022 RepID=A0A9E6XXL5_9ACTN|nr:isochorismate synthase [Capillimicrobium parvum]UGS36251.1 Salicylate biosynthesis isochorismate synthase [Capillimicrobium parvum]